MEGPAEKRVPWDKLILTDSLGQPFSIDQLRGRLVLINFFFTSCQSICPPQTAGLMNAWTKLDAQEKEAIVILSITIDPENDTIAKLATYKQNFRIADSSWVFGRGAPEATTQLGEHFGSLSGDSKPLAHKGRIYLIDPKGNYLLSFASPPQIDSSKLAKELSGAVKVFMKNSRIQ
ncbi:MAG TPA: SCO family protein [Oligoflexus sp.]|uniref:SCO family protein n=1 Tax=Oligoflexus sp. TaxID=1971216 RepID=UPI002D530382|nr:SCO family protein [Oligoflexus sp.]HYX33498.1 SCO family protein [Oligoflexus sp.]